MHPLGTCPYKQDENHTCRGNAARGPIICNMIAETHSSCPYYYRMAELHDLKLELWSGNTCCQEYRYLMLDCAEPSGFMAGAVDIRIYPNDGKDVWRNYRRLRFLYCPYCGTAVE